MTSTLHCKARVLRAHHVFSYQLGIPDISPLGTRETFIVVHYTPT